MPESTKEEIAEAARNRFKTKDIPIGKKANGEDIAVTVRELSPAAKKILEEKLWQRDAEGKFIILDKEGKTPKAGEDGWYQLIDGVGYTREWLLATMQPADSVEDILSDEVPYSVRKEILDEALVINREKSQAAIAKNS